MTDIDDRRHSSVLNEKRDATRYRILVEVAERQPAVSQREIADAIGVTSQAVSEYVSDLVAEGFVEKRGRGRYEITREGVDWLISRTDELQRFVEYVSDELVGGVEIDAAIARNPIAEGDAVLLSMEGGFLHATPGEGSGATAVAVTDADAGEVVGVTDFDGLLDYEPGTVTILAVPHVGDDGDPDLSAVDEHAKTGELLAVHGTEALAAVRQIGLTPDITFGAADAVPEAAARGVDLVLVTTETAVAEHADRLREANITYEVHEVTAPIP